MPSRSKPLKNGLNQNPNHGEYKVPSHGVGMVPCGGNANKYHTNVQMMLPMITEWIAEGKTDIQIYKTLGISEASWYRYKEEQPELQEAVKTGKGRLVMKLEMKACEKILRDSDTDYKHDALHMFMLKKNSPDKYNDKNDKKDDIPVGTIQLEVRNMKLPDNALNDVVQDVIDGRDAKSNDKG